MFSSYRKEKYYIRGICYRVNDKYMTPGMISCNFPSNVTGTKYPLPVSSTLKKEEEFLHFLDAIFVDSFQILCSINENCRDEMTESIKDVPIKHSVLH